MELQTSSNKVALVQLSFFILYIIYVDREAKIKILRRN
nr:MAG TPA: hypothetical protein [Caudoviricetes sp.]